MRFIRQVTSVTCVQQGITKSKGQQYRFFFSERNVLAFPSVLTSVLIMLHFLSVSWPFPRQQKQELTFNRHIESPSLRSHFLKCFAPQKLSISSFFPCLWLFKICESNKVCLVISRLNGHPRCIGTF